jgi:hypothetical protein
MGPAHWGNKWGITDWRLAVLERLDAGAAVEVEFMLKQDYVDNNLGDALYDAVLMRRVS